MSSAVVHHDTGLSQAYRVPACQWSFNRAHRFHHVSGDSASLFHRLPAELLRQPVSLIDDPQCTWSARLDRLFSGHTLLDRWTAENPGAGHTLIQIPIRANDSGVMYIAGFAFPAGSACPHISQLELVAMAGLQLVETERTRATRFLHDIVAQSLSGTGFQLELLQQEIQAENTDATKHAAAIQQALEEVLQRIREFSAKE